MSEGTTKRLDTWVAWMTREIKNCDQKPEVYWTLLVGLKRSFHSLAYGFTVLVQSVFASSTFS